MALRVRDLLTRGPGALRRRLAALPHRLRVAAARRGSAHRCVACGSRIGAFLPHREGPATLSEFLHRIGYGTGDLVNHQCPVCLGSDRERHLILYFDALGMWDRVPGSRILHFAPEPALRARLRTHGPARYVAADLMPSDPETVPLDVTAIAEPDESFDLLICNHVLEHVDDVGAALSEMFRVLAPGGTAVLQTPFASGLARTFEDPAIASEADRLFFYGQEDHARVFGLDLFEAMERAGFEVSRVEHGEVLGDLDARYEGVSPEEPLILASRPASRA